ncbi:MAG: preprotein translocase subunit YajC [Clostridiales bacterium]|nr:preprotein translocase subunit YajC [Clostridiales bacterium]
MLSMFLEAGAQAAGQQSTAGSWLVLIGELGFFFLIIYFLMIRPQKKQQQQMENLRDSVRPGDNIMTTGGFYGVVLDVVDDTVIVEFGNNKNCRIPMHKNAIAEVERDDEETDEKDSKK